MKFEFLKIFTEATPAFNPGDQITDSITYVSRESFLEWVLGVNEQNRKGNCPYRVELIPEAHECDDDDYGGGHNWSREDFARGT